MKNIILPIACALLLVSCGTQKRTNNTPDVALENSNQEPTATVEPASNQIEAAAKKQQATLINGNLQGIASLEDFQTQPFDAWFGPRFDNYNPDAAVVSELETALDGVTIRGFMGTWCGDSKRETPKFYKLLEVTNYDLDDLTLVTVDRSKSKPTELVEGYDVQRVPTFIFYKDGKELGRFVEYPRETLEADILKIVTGEDYKHSYEN